MVCPFEWGELTATDMASLNHWIFVCPIFGQTHNGPGAHFGLIPIPTTRSGFFEATERGFHSFNDGAGFWSFCFNSARFFSRHNFEAMRCWLLPGHQVVGFSVVGRGADDEPATL